MRAVLCAMGLLTALMTLQGCGQTGALQLPNDPNYDHRAKYLIYSAPKSAEQTPIDQPQASDPITQEKSEKRGISAVF